MIAVGVEGLNGSDRWSYVNGLRLFANDENLMIWILHRQAIENAETRLVRQFPSQLLANDGTQPLATLRQRHRHAMHSACAVHRPSDWGEVFFEAIRGLGFRPQEDATRFEGAPDTGQSSTGVRHVVDTVERHHEVEMIS